MIDRLLSQIAPHRCCFCRQNGQLLCEKCKYYIENETPVGCVLCAVPCGLGGLCRRCQTKTGAIQAWCVGERQGPLKELINAYKFDCQRSGARQLADLLDFVLPLLPSETVVVGVPTASRAVRVRGFDHVGLVVKQLAKRRRLKTAEVLKRESNVTLHLLDRKARLELADSLFSLRVGPKPKVVLLVDDIVTTGTTMGGASKLLREAGVEQLYLACLARQSLQRK